MNKKYLFLIMLHVTHTIIFAAVVQKIFFLHHVVKQIVPLLFKFGCNNYQKNFARHMNNSFCITPSINYNSRFFLNPLTCNHSIKSIVKNIDYLQSEKNLIHIPNLLISDCFSVNIPETQQLNIGNNTTKVNNVSAIYFLKYFFMSLYFFKNEVKKIDNFEPQEIPFEELCRLFMYL
jgi:hypothetical protein